jgi:rubrerythrin
MAKQELVECPICGQTYDKNDYEYCPNCEEKERIEDEDFNNIVYQRN